MPRRFLATLGMTGRMLGMTAWLVPASLLLACGPASAPAPAQDPGATPQYGGFMHIPARPDFISKDPYQGGAGSERNLKAYPVYEPLVTYRYEPGIDYRIKNEVVPWLAEKWEQRGQA